MPVELCAVLDEMDTASALFLDMTPFAAVLSADGDEIEDSLRLLLDSVRSTVLALHELAGPSAWWSRCVTLCSDTLHRFEVMRSASRPGITPRHGRPPI